MTSTKITPARRSALEVLVSHSNPRVSNSTEGDLGLIYWQTAEWLLEHGYAERRNSRSSIDNYLRPTSAAFDLAATLDVEVAQPKRYHVNVGWNLDDDVPSTFVSLDRAIDYIRSHLVHEQFYCVDIKMGDQE